MVESHAMKILCKLLQQTHISIFFFLLTTVESVYLVLQVIQQEVGGLQKQQILPQPWVPLVSLQVLMHCLLVLSHTICSCFLGKI